MKKILLTICLLFSIQIVTAQEVPLYETVKDNIPEIGVVTEVYLGDRMLEQRTGEYRECIIPKKTFEETWGRVLFVVKANEPLCKKNADSKYYYLTYNLVPETRMANYVARLIDNKDGYELRLGTDRTSRKLSFKNINKDDIEINDRWFIYQKDSFQQTIEYAGKSGNVLKFVYSEFAKGYARDAFNREFQVDLSEGNVLAFKGAIIEIESASNINILYKVIRNFRD